jgi:UDP-N-acetylmuramate dehydrogenase
MNIEKNVIKSEDTITNVLIQSDIPLKDKNWFKTGGNARYFAEPKSAQEFQQALSWANANGCAIFILGHGANILISDDGFNGLVIKPQLHNITIVDQDKHCLLTVGAGMSMHDLITFCLDNALLGLEEFSGIPGTVGGSVYINLHYFEFLLEQFLVHATIIHKDTNLLEQVSHAWFAFGYNQSKLQSGNYYLVDATFKLKRATAIEAAFARGRHVEVIRHRERKYPTQNTCGSFFRNFYPDEVTSISNGKKMIYVAYYLDKLGIKGQLSYGGAAVSYQHANMIVNQGTATSADIIALARMMQEMVRNQFGIIPQPECRLIGFEKYPLL